MKTFTEDTLREAREKLLSRDALLRDRLERVQADLRRPRDPVPSSAPAAAVGREKDEVLAAIESSAYAERRRIKTALDRVEDDTLGLCAGCGREIEAARFVAVPYATHCKTCAPDA